MKILQKFYVISGKLLKFVVTIGNSLRNVYEYPTYVLIRRIFRKNSEKDFINIQEPEKFLKDQENFENIQENLEVTVKFHENFDLILRLQVNFWKIWF